MLLRVAFGKERASTHTRAATQRGSKLLQQAKCCRTRFCVNVSAGVARRGGCSPPPSPRTAVFDARLSAGCRTRSSRSEVHLLQMASTELRPRPGVALPLHTRRGLLNWHEHGPLLAERVRLEDRAARAHAEGVVIHRGHGPYHRRPTSVAPVVDDRAPLRGRLRRCAASQQASSSSVASDAARPWCVHRYNAKVVGPRAGAPLTKPLVDFGRRAPQRAASDLDVMSPTVRPRSACGGSTRQPRSSSSCTGASSVRRHVAAVDQRVARLEAKLDAVAQRDAMMLAQFQELRALLRPQGA